jgi:HSP20 family protein
MALPARRRREDRGRSSQPVRWLPSEPFAHFDDIHRRMQQMIRSMAEDPITLQQRWSPAVDIEETDDAYLVEVDLPGVSRGDVRLGWNDRQLTLHGQVRERVRTGFLHQQTRRLGQFHYTVPLPGEVDGGKIDASLTDGLLTVRAPKPDNAKSHRIEITEGLEDDRPAGISPE